MVANVILANKYVDSSYNAKNLSIQNKNAENIFVEDNNNVAISGRNFYTGTAECTTKEEFFANCVANGNKDADTLEGYKKLRQEKSDTKGLSEADYENEFHDYITYRGCKSSAELRELDSAKGTFYGTKNDLMQFVKNSISSLDEYLEDCNCPTISSSKDFNTILEKANTGDLVNFAENFQKKGPDKVSFGKKVSGLVTLLSKTMQNTDLNIDIKKYLMSYIEKINSKWNEITNYSVYLTKKEKEEEENAKKAQQISMQKDVSKNTAFKNSEPLQNSTLSSNDNGNSANTQTTENFKKYNETLISQYQN